jgi:hypothetical protein
MTAMGRSDFVAGINKAVFALKRKPRLLSLLPIKIDNALAHALGRDADIVVGFAPPCVDLGQVDGCIFEAVFGRGFFSFNTGRENRNPCVSEVSRFFVAF